MDPNDEMSMDPGPRDPSILHLQSKHRSNAIWKVGGGDCQRSRKGDPNQARFPKVHERMIPILLDLRFDGISRLSSIDLDWGLITALIEHWRPETHTFHLPVGECSITLQDVNVLLGLRIDGDAVTGGTQVNGGWASLVKQIFGIDPGKSLSGAQLRLSCLTENFQSIRDDASDVELIRYTQSYLLQLFAGVLFTDHSGGQIHCMYLPSIQDFGRCRTLAWGSAVLAFLYRDLCKACRIGVKENAGCLILLQLWAWTRLPTLAPVPRGPSLDNAVIWGDQPGPYGLRWCSHLSFTDTTSHALSAVRLSLDGLAPSHFIWQPYSSEILAALPNSCVDGSAIWCYKGPLIYFHVVEPHTPNRCMRQFGFIQDIPPNDTYSKELHSITLHGSVTRSYLFCC